MFPARGAVNYGRKKDMPPRTGRQNLLRQYGRSFQESGCAKRLEYIGEEVGGAFIDRELAAPFPNFRDS